jgi:hypothetical protein
MQAETWTGTGWMPLPSVIPAARDREDDGRRPCLRKNDLQRGSSISFMSANTEPNIRRGAQ